MQRSSSSSKPRLHQFYQCNSVVNLLNSHSRERQVDRTRNESSNSKPRVVPQKSSGESFIKVKKPANSSLLNSSRHQSERTAEGIPSTHPLQYKIQGDLSKLNDITSKFTLKTIEKMKKEYSFSANHEAIYKNLLALLSELDEIFNENQVLRFSMSRAREIFQVYMSRTGHALKTLKAFAGLAENVRVPKSIISKCRHDIKNIATGKLDEFLFDLYEVIRIVVKVQSEVFKGEKVFLYRETDMVRDGANTKTQETLVTEERTLDVSIMELHTQTVEDDNSFNSPVFTCESEECEEIVPIRKNSNQFTSEKSNKQPIISKNSDRHGNDKRSNCNSNENQSSKSRLLEKLYQKMNFTPFATEESEVENSHSVILNDESLVLQEKKINHDSASSGIRIKLSRRSSSGSNLPNYMKNIKKNDFPKYGENLENLNSRRIINKAVDRKGEWEELRKVINI